MDESLRRLRTFIVFRGPSRDHATTSTELPIASAAYHFYTS